MTHMHDIQDPASLAARLAAAHALPPSPPAGEWTRRYEDHGTFFLGHATPGWNPVGELRVARRLVAQDEQELVLEQWRDALAGFRSVTKATVRARVDTLATPLHWRVETAVVEHATGDVVPGTAMTKELSLEGGTLLERAGAASTRTRLAGGVAIKLCLLEALGRATPGMSAEFSLLDEYDEVLPGQRLVPQAFEPATTKGGGRLSRAWRHTGRGAMPGTYWADGSGRVLFYMAGAQALVLVEENSVRAKHLFADKEFAQ